MKPKHLLPIIMNVLWLFVGGILAFWIGKLELPWLIAGIIIILIGSLGINQAIFDARKKK